MKRHSTTMQSEAEEGEEEEEEDGSGPVHSTKFPNSHDAKSGNGSPACGVVGTTHVEGEAALAAPRPVVVFRPQAVSSSSVPSAWKRIRSLDDGPEASSAKLSLASRLVTSVVVEEGGDEASDDDLEITYEKTSFHSSSSGSAANSSSVAGGGGGGGRVISGSGVGGQLAVNILPISLSSMIPVSHVHLPSVVSCCVVCESVEGGFDVSSSAVTNSIPQLPSFDLMNSIAVTPQFHDLLQISIIKAISENYWLKNRLNYSLRSKLGFS